MADLDNILIFVKAAHAWEQGTRPVDSAIECRDTDPLGGHLRVAALTTRALRTDEPGKAVGAATPPPSPPVRSVQRLPWDVRRKWRGCPEFRLSASSPCQS